MSTVLYPQRRHLDGTAFGYPSEPERHTRWYDGEAGPMVRSYALVQGRTVPTGREFDLIALVVSDLPEGSDPPVGPEHGAILGLCRDDALSVAEIAAETDLPLGVVRVLLGDLLTAGYVRVRRPVPPALLPDEHILREVIHGLRAL
ncbi:DUF742 domain-containing protein [Kitasatospora albolonga]